MHVSTANILKFCIFIITINCGRSYSSCNVKSCFVFPSVDRSRVIKMADLNDEENVEIKKQSPGGPSGNDFDPGLTSLGLNEEPEACRPRPPLDRHHFETGDSSADNCVETSGNKCRLYR